MSKLEKNIMQRKLRLGAALAGITLSTAAVAGGSNYGIPPGAHPVLPGKGGEGPGGATGSGNGPIGRLGPSSGRMREYQTPSRGGGPHTLVITDDGVIWFTMQSGNKIGRFDTRASGQITEYKTSGGPYGLTLDKAGNVWFCRMGDDKLGKLDPRTGQMSEVSTGPRSP